jgi:hypothetical protein
VIVVRTSRSFSFNPGPGAFAEAMAPRRRFTRRRDGPGLRQLRHAAAVLAVVGGIVVTTPSAQRPQVVLPALQASLVSHYDFDHPVASDPTTEMDLGSSGTPISLINGGAAMRVEESAYPGSGRALRTQQLNPTVNGNDDWKAGIYAAGGVPSLGRFNAVAGITLMGWIKPNGTNPNPNSVSAAPGDAYSAIGLFGLLAGNSDGHSVRALLELINVAGTMRLVALGRRLDTGDSLTLAATDDWQTLLPMNRWTHVAATFDFDAGTMALYRDGEPLPSSYTPAGDRWSVAGDPEPDLTSPTNPAGIKIGGSFPQNSLERNAFNGLLDDLMFLDRSLSANDVRAQFARFRAGARSRPVSRDQRH